MRYALAQLRKLSLPYRTSEDLDLSEDLNGYEDILESSPAHIEYEIHEVSLDKYLVRMDIEIELVLESAISLKRINKTISCSSDEIYVQNPGIDEDVNPFIGQTLDTREAVLTNILCEKPMRSVGEDEYFESDYIDEDEAEEEAKANSPFASLADLLKK